MARKAIRSARANPKSEIPNRVNAVSHLSATATSNTCLAAALTAVGIPLAEKPFVRVVGDGIRGERTVWFFEPQSQCGKFQTKELIAAWHDEVWHHTNPGSVWKTMNRFRPRLPSGGG